MSADREALNAAEAAAWIERARAGDFAAAWALSDRIRDRTAQPDWTRPRHLQQVWNGTPLDGRRTLIRCYHGLGDTIQFVRYAPMVRAIASEVSVWAQPALLPLLATVDGIDRLLPLHDGKPGVTYDVDVEVMELPYVFRSTLDTLPARVPYLSADAATLDPDDRPRVGVVWRGGDWDTGRSLAFAQLAPLLARTSIRWYSLQVDARSDERHTNLTTLDVGTIPRTAEQMRALDLVISIDSMSAHLAGALAVPVWTLLMAHADWRWLERRTDTPWYPTMRLFRQAEPGDWDGVIRAVGEALQARL